jgi:hypothetical protein
VNGVKEGLAYTSGDQVILAVDTAEDVAARNSLRMVSKTTFNAKDMNLFIFDIAQMPAVCGTCAFKLSDILRSATDISCRARCLGALTLVCIPPFLVTDP